MSDEVNWRQLWLRHSGKIAGALAGFLLGLFVMWVGLGWALFIGLTAFLGYWVGARVDMGARDVPEWLERWLPPGRR